MEKVITIYWAAPPFSQAERIWNRLCANYLRKQKGYNVILPQDEVKKFMVDDEIKDKDGYAEYCRCQSINCDVAVDVLDGPDADSGASVEMGIKIENIRAGGNGITLGVRTDFRVSEDEHQNLMFRLLTDRFYFPSFNESYKELCDEIDRRIKKLLQAKQRD